MSPFPRFEVLAAVKSIYRSLMISLRRNILRTLIIAVPLMVLLLLIPRGCDLLWGNAPMCLYGKLVDQAGNPVPDACVTFNGVSQAYFQLPLLTGQGRELTHQIRVIAEHDGKFIVNGGWGTTLQLRSIERSGYESACLYETFHFGHSRPGPTYHADASHPAIFLCWNDALKRIISRQVAAEADGRIQTLSYRSGRVSPFGIGDENLHFRVLRPKGNPQQPYDWSLELSSVYPRTAEVTASVGQLRAEAPASGYVHDLVFKMQASEPNWSSQMTRSFYTCNNDGGVYAGVEMQVQLPTNGGDATVTIRYAADFGKSRDLVPGIAARVGK